MTSVRCASVVFLLYLAACGPMTREAAERDCFERARLTTQPRGEIGVGVTDDGPAVTGKITVTSDFVQGRDPSAVYDACVVQKSGQPPSQPLYTRPDWKG